MRWLSVFLLILNANVASAVEMGGMVNYGDQLQYNGQAQSGTDPAYSALTIRLFVSCFAVDNVDAPNPMSRDSTIRFSIGLGNPMSEITVLFPAWLATKNLDDVELDQLLVLGPPGNPAAGNPIVREAAGYHGMVRIRTAAITGVPTLDASGNYSTNSHVKLIRYMDFYQDICSGVAHPDCGGGTNVYTSNSASLEKSDTKSMTALLFDSYFGPVLRTLFGDEAHAGIPNPTATPNYDIGNYGDNFFGVTAAAADPMFINPAALDHRYVMGSSSWLSAQVKSHWSSDFKDLDIHVAFPGYRDICGALYTPLLLFFDDARPRFLGAGKFKINSAGIKTNWPEAGSPGYFLVLDRNGNGAIDDFTEMFGSESGQFKNGFEALRELDENGDGRIDRRDPAFSRLKLWRDKNGDGVSQPDELFSLEDLGVTSISLNYDLNTVVAMGPRAQLREKSKFTFVRDGVRKKGTVIDVWLSTER